jgi:hypothetical protein
MFENKNKVDKREGEKLIYWEIRHEEQGSGDNMITKVVVWAHLAPYYPSLTK